MFFFLSKTIGLLLNPMVWIVLSFILGWTSKRYRKKLFRFGIVATVIFSNPFLSNKAFSVIEGKPTEIDGKISVGIVLTGMMHSSNNTAEQMQLHEGADRITEAIRLYKRGKIGKIIISGGSGKLANQEFTESKELGIWLDHLGIPKRDIILETRSRNTRENAEFTSDLEVITKLTNPPLLITSAFHMRRSIGCFKKAGVEVIPFPVDFRSSEKTDYTYFVPSATAIAGWEVLFREMFGLLVYKTMGYI